MPILMAIPQVMFLFVKSDHCTTVSKTYQTLYTIVTRKIVEVPTATPGCERIVTLLLCHSALPKCIHDSPDQPMLGCSEHCRLRDLLQRACPLQYSRYKTIVDRESNLFISPSCSVNSSQCMRVTAESLSKLLFGLCPCYLISNHLLLHVEDCYYFVVCSFCNIYYKCSEV